MDIFGFLLVLGSIITGVVFLILAIVSVAKKNGKLKRSLIGAGSSLAVFVLGIVLFVSSLSVEDTEIAASNYEEEISGTEEEMVEETEVVEEADVVEEVEETPQTKMIKNIQMLIEEGQAYDAGSYIKGDIPKGEYAFITFTGGGQYYSEEDSAGNIIDNENFDSFGYVYVQEAGNLQTDGVLVSPDSFSQLEVGNAKELYEIINVVENYSESGYYKVGSDIAAGQYTIESYGEGYVSVVSGPIGNSEIIDNELFNGRYNVTVADGQYLQISRGKIAQ